MRAIVWAGWSHDQVEFELAKIKHLPLKYEWISAYKQNPASGDIWLTGDGRDYRNGPIKNVSIYAESFKYARSAYENFHTDQNWDHRFHFNQNFAVDGLRLSLLRLPGWWSTELTRFNENKTKTREYQFGMILGKKGVTAGHIDVSWLRDQVVQQLRKRSFRYYGGSWDKADPNYGGELYLYDRSSNLAFLYARELMSECRFVFALENIYDSFYSDNYLTEKIFHAFLSGAVPVYLGCYNVEKLISPDLFVDLRKFGVDRAKPESIGKAADFCEAMTDADYRGYLERIEAFLNGPGKQFTKEHRYLTVDEVLFKRFG